MTDRLSKWTDAYKKQTYPNGWPKKKTPWSRMTAKKESHLRLLQTHNVHNVKNTNGTI